MGTGSVAIVTERGDKTALISTQRKKAVKRRQFLRGDLANAL